MPSSALVDGTTQSARVAPMAQVNPSSPRPLDAVARLDPLPNLRLELRHGSARPVFYEVSELGFLVGSVPGCDLRLPGTELPPVLCLVTRHAGGAAVRKLVPTQPILVNGQLLVSGPLANGDRLSLGSVEIVVHLRSTPAAQFSERDDTGPGEHVHAGAVFQQREAFEAEQKARREELEAYARQLDLRRQQLEEQTEELEADRVIWYRRREEIEQECQRRAAPQDVEVTRPQEQAPAIGTVKLAPELTHQQRDLQAREELLARQQQELAGLRQELADIRRQLYDRYRQRRDRLAGLQEAVDRAARKVQERKRQIDTELEHSSARVRELDARQSALEKREDQLAGDLQLLEERDRSLSAREQEWHRADASRQAEYEAREQELAKQREALEKDQAQYQADLARLDRLQDTLEQRQQQLQERARETDQQFEQLQRASRELEEQARDLTEWHDKLRAEASRLSQQKSEQQAASVQHAQRTATLEGQQAMLASLRTRLERMREEVRREQQRLTEQQTRLDASEIELQQRLEEARRLRAELDSEKQLSDQERRQLEERRTTLDAAVAQLGQAQEALARKECELDRRIQAIDAAAGKQAEEAKKLGAEAEQLREAQQRLATDRQALGEREASLAQMEQARGALQEQLRRRSEELAERQRSLADQARKQDEVIATLETRREEMERERKQADEQLAKLRQELDSRGTALEQQQAELLHREETLHHRLEQLKRTGRKLAAARKSLHEERQGWLAVQQEAQEATARTRAELEAARHGVVDLQQQLPELMLRAQAAAERLTQAREQLRNHVQELHAYAHQSQEAVEALRSDVQIEAGQVREQQQALHRACEEHRLAVAAFRQQLIEWQGQLTEMRRSLAQGETRLERRQAEVDQQARQIDATSTRLAQQAEQLQAQERIVAERRQEIERHLDDMREWYRRKLRELSQARSAPVGAEGEPTNARQRSVRHDLLTIPQEVEPADRKLGELLLTLHLVDADTLAALLDEAGRQHRSLRQALLAGGYLTLYQMALIETGNLDGLVLGPLRVIDRLRVTPCEAVYRVFDPRRNQEAILRHLAESEMEDAVHPDEFRQRFGQAATVRHPQVAATLEVLEINGRPGVLQEWYQGVPSNDWPALASVPGVWFRLLSQATLGLNAAHQAGLIHGHLQPASFVLNGEGIVKLCGLGEPRWLLVPPPTGSEESVAGDLADLGWIAADWASITARRKGAKGKPLPEVLQTVLDRLTTPDIEQRHASASALLEELERIASAVPAHAEARERFLQQIQLQSAGGTAWRQSA